MYDVPLTSRRGIAMIELIFAIVIMAIVLLSAPTLINQSVKSSYVGLQQEAVNAAASHLNLIMTKEWDEGNADLRIDPRVLMVSDNADPRLAPLDAMTPQRAGTPITSRRRFITSMGDSTFATDFANFGSRGDLDENASMDDIDDYHLEEGRLRVITEVEDESNTNYKDRNILMTTTVRYIRDIPTSGGDYNTNEDLVFDNPFISLPNFTSNIKAVSVTLTTDVNQTELAKEITLSAFMCNIGHFQLATRN